MTRLTPNHLPQQSCADRTRYAMAHHKEDGTTERFVAAFWTTPDGRDVVTCETNRDGFNPTIPVLQFLAYMRLGLVVGEHDMQDAHKLHLTIEGRERRDLVALCRDVIGFAPPFGHVSAYTQSQRDAVWTALATEQKEQSAPTWDSDWRREMQQIFNAGASDHLPA